MTLAFPLEVRHMHNNPPASLTHQYAYAHTLARAIYRNEWTDPSKRLDYGEDIPFRILGGSMIPTPSVIVTHHHGHTRAGIPPARIAISNPDYYQAILELPDREADAWMDWLTPRFDKEGNLADPARLFRPNGDKWSRNNDHTEPAAQDAALAILAASTVRIRLDSVR